MVDPTGDSTFPMMLQQEGQGYFKDGEVAVGTPEAVTAMTVMKQLNDKGLVDYEKGWDALVSGGVIDPDVLWSCTSCGACVQQCPVKPRSEQAACNEVDGSVTRHGIVVRMNDHGFARRQVEIFEADIGRSHRVTLDEWLHRPWGEKLIEKFVPLLDWQL